MVNIFNRKDDLCDVFSRYIRLQQVPCFVSALFHSLNCIESVGSDSPLLYPVQFLRKLAEEVPRLPVTQINEIWDLCISNSSLLAKRAKSGSKATYLQFQLSLEVFRIFLLHIKIDTERNESSIRELLKNTAVFLKEAVQMCAESSSEDNLFAVIGVCHAWGEMKLAMKKYTEDFRNHSTLENTSHFFDLSGIHDYFSSEDWISFHSKFSASREVRLQYFVILLLLQKARGVSLETPYSQLETSDVVSHIVKKSKCIQFAEVNQVWNGEPTYIHSGNYPVAFWCCFLKHIPCLVYILKEKHWLYLASRITEILITADSVDNILFNGQSTVTLTKQFLNGPFFPEIRLLQSAYVTEFFRLTSAIFQGEKRKSDCDLVSSRKTIIWNLYSSEKMWMKLANTTPKNNDKSLNELWEKVKNVSEMLNDVLRLKEKEKIDAKFLPRLLNLFDYLPLEYLLPGNQIRCLFGLIVFMSCIPSMSQNVDSTVVQTTMIEVCKAILAILDGARSIWLLSFVDISLLLKATVKIASCVFTATDYFNDVQKWIRLLLKSFVGLSMKSVTTFTSLRLFIEDLVTQLYCNDCSEPAIMCVSILLSRFNDALRRTHIQLNYEAICREHAELLASAFEKFIKNKDKIGNELEMECYQELLDFKCLPSDGNIEITYLKEVIEQELTSLEKANTALCDANVKFFSTICQNIESLKSCVPENFSQKLWFSASKFYTRGVEPECKDIRNNMPKFDETREDVVRCMIEQCIKKQKGSLVQQFCVSSNNERNTVSNSNEAEILKISIKYASAEEFKSIVQYTVQLTDTIGDIETIVPVLQLWKIIVGSVSDTSHKEILRAPITNLMKKLFFLLSKQNCFPNMLEISINILDFCSLVLHKGKGLLIHQSILICMELCVMAPLQSFVCHSQTYISMFEQVYNILNEIMIQHFYCVLCAPSCFIACLAYILTCQIQASNQNYVIKCDSGTQEKLDICAQKLCKLMSLISEHRTEFSKLVATVIATYVNEVEKVTIFPTIKEHLLIGLNKLIKICDSYCLNVLQKTLKHGSREVFKTLLNDHKSHFKYFGHV